MLKKITAAVATLALALGMVAVTATSASAHHNTIDGYVTCTTDFKYQVNWTVTNSETDKTETITASDRTSAVPVGATLTAGQAKVFTENVTTNDAITMTLTGTWSNGVTHQDSGTVKKNSFPDCTPQHVPVTLCHATPPDDPNKWEDIRTDDDGALGHNAQHDADIIPAFTYWAKVNGVWTQVDFPGKNLNTNFGGYLGSQILASGCELNVAPTAPTFTPAVCTAPGVAGLGSYTIPTVVGVKYSVRLNNAGAYAEKSAGVYNVPVGTFIQVKAESTSKWVHLTGTTTWSYTYASPGDCIVTVTPVAPTVVPITECGVYGSVTPQTTTGVVYELISGNGLSGAYTVRATPAAGYKFTGPQFVDFSGNLGVFTTCATPEAPTFDDSECTAPGEESGGSYTIPVTEGVLYQVKIGDDPWADAAAGTFPVSVFPTTVQVRAVAIDGYSLTDYDGPWSHTFESAGACRVLSTPVAPDVELITECGKYGSVTPQDTTGVVYELTLGDGMQGAFTVTATPADGYYFDGAQSVEFSGNLGTYTECVTPTAPTFTESVCVADEPGESESAFFTIPSKDGVVYSVSINGGAYSDYSAGDYDVADGDSVTVKATAELDYTLQGTTQWAHVFAEEQDCLVSATPAEPSFTESECSPEPPALDGPQATLSGFPISGYFTIPSTPGVKYFVSINGGAATEYAAGDYDVADGDKVTVTAEAESGYTLEGTYEWEHTFGELGECDLPTKAEVFAAASATNATCTSAGSINVVLADHVLYFLDGSPLLVASTPKPAGTYTVTAATDNPLDYTIIGQTEWDLTVAGAGTCPTVLAMTGSSMSLIGLSFGGGLVFLGVVALYMRRRNGMTAE